MEIIRQRYPDEFKRWGPQIATYASQLTPENRTVDMLEKVIGVVRSEHIDEIVAERSKRALDEMIEKGTVVRPGAAGGAPAQTAAVSFDALPPNYKEILAEYKITPETLDEFLVATEVSAKGVSLNDARKAWLERASKNDIITEKSIAIGGRS
jgi:cytosine/adenosine deaminase-related metal-dependent hydrolase